MIRLTFQIPALIALTGLSASLMALEIEPQTGGLVFGNDAAKSQSLSWHGGLANRQLDQGWERSEDAVFENGTTLRKYGLGFSLDGAFAVGQDKGAIQLTDNHPTTYKVRPIKPGELLQVNAKLDYIIQVDGVYAVGAPFLQFIPHFEYVTYPNQSGNVLKDNQLWAGADIWWSTPLEGVELGTSHEWNLQDPAYRGAIAVRELQQFAPYDLIFWQTLNFGSRTYHRYFLPVDKTGVTTADLGVKVRTPMAWREWWTYVGADWSYWLNKDDREARSTLGRDAGDFTFSVGVEWRAE